MRKYILAKSVVAALLATALFSSEASAQVDIFLSVRGISGESTDSRHKDWIEVLAVSEILNGGASASSAGKASGRASVGSFSITKRLDKASPILKLDLMQGKHFSELTIEFCKAGGEKMNFYTITLKDVVITSIRSTAENGAQAEEVFLDFGSIEWSYTPISGGGKGASVSGGWDLKANKKL